VPLKTNVFSSMVPRSLPNPGGLLKKAISRHAFGVTIHPDAKTSERETKKKRLPAPQPVSGCVSEDEHSNEPPVVSMLCGSLEWAPQTQGDEAGEACSGGKACLESPREGELTGR